MKIEVKEFDRVEPSKFILFHKLDLWVVSEFVIKYKNTYVDFNPVIFTSPEGQYFEMDGKRWYARGQ